MKYVDICIAIYNYEAQNGEEISFHADDILYILNKEDRDWFKAQLKVNTDLDGPIGLVPSNYIEKAKPIGSLKALYDYEARSKEEISFKENDTLSLFEKDDPDWYIVEASNGDIGLVPSNYVSEATPAVTQQKWALALYNFTPEGKEETYLHENEKVIVIKDDNADWWTVQHTDGTLGIVPATYLQLQGKNEEEKKKLEEFNRMKELEEKEKERKAEAERRRKLQEEAKQLEIKKQQQQLAPPVVPSPQLGSPRRSQIPAPPPPTQTPLHQSNSPSSFQSPSDPNKPNPAKVRTWTDNTGAFKVEAQFLACTNGKIRLHKVNGVKIDVPVGKMCMEDLRYVERETGLKLMEDKNDNIPLAQLQKGKFSWLDYFKHMNLPHNASVEYAGTFEANQLTEKDIDKLTYLQMKMLGMSEKHIHRFQRYIETNRAEPPSDDESTAASRQKPKLKVKKSVTFGGVSYIDDIRYDDEDDQWPVEQEQHHVSLQRRGTGRPTPAHSAPQNVNFSVLTPQPFQQQQTTPQETTSQSFQQQQTTPQQNISTISQPKPGFEDDAWAPRPSSSPSIQNNTRSITNNVPPPPARQRPTPPVSQQSMVDPELLARWGGSPAFAAANNRPVPAVPLQQQQNTPTSSFIPIQQTGSSFTPLQHQNTFSTLPTTTTHQFTPLQHQNSFPGALQPNQIFQQPSPNMMNSFQPNASPLPPPLIPQATSNSNISFTPPQTNNMIQPQMTGRNWATATPDNPFGNVQPQNTAMFQQTQNTGFVNIDPNDKYAVFKTMNNAPSVFNTGH